MFCMGLNHPLCSDRCDIMSSCEWLPSFRVNISPPSLVLNPADEGGGISLALVAAARYYVSERHD
jgi:hypothetical protein